MDAIVARPDTTVFPLLAEHVLIQWNDTGNASGLSE